MRIVVHDFIGHAFQVQLSRELARRGHNVLHLHFPAFETPKGPLLPRPADPPGLAIEGLSIKARYRKYSFVSRLRAETRYGEVCNQRINAFKPDVVLSGNTPPL